LGSEFTQGDQDAGGHQQVGASIITGGDAPPVLEAAKLARSKVLRVLVPSTPAKCFEGTALRATVQSSGTSLRNPGTTRVARRRGAGFSGFAQGDGLVLHPAFVSMNGCPLRPSHRVAARCDGANSEALQLVLPCVGILKVGLRRVRQRQQIWSRQ
jgi:hypothetical protein